jgi:hypothetical protein
MNNKTRVALLMHLDPDKAEQLDELAAEARTMKSVLLRDAVDLLLARRGKLEPGPEVKFVVKAVREAREVIAFCRSNVARGRVLITRCNDAIESLDEALQRLKEI